MTEIFINNNQNNYDYDNFQADLNGLNTAVANFDEHDENSPDVQLNPPEVVNELTDVPVLSDALVSEKKALKIFKAPLETHDNFERTLNRKHKFSFFEKVLCVISFGLASPIIKHLNKSNDRREAQELKENTLTINQTLAHLTKGGPAESVGVDLYENGKVVHTLLERNEQDQLFIKFPGVEQKIRLPYDLEHMRTLISSDICSHIDIFGLDSALIGLDSQDKDINRRSMLTNILSHMTGGEKTYHELSVMDYNSLESIVKNIRDNSEKLRDSGSNDEEIQQSNKEYLETQLNAIEQKCKLVNTKLKNSIGQKEVLYDESVKQIQAKLHEFEIQKLKTELNTLNAQKTFYDSKIKELSPQLNELNAKEDKNPGDLQKIQNIGANLNDYQAKLTEVLEKVEALQTNIVVQEDALKSEVEELGKPKAPEQIAVEENNAPVVPGETDKYSPKVNSLYVDSIIEKLEAEKKESPQSVSEKIDTHVIPQGTDNKYNQKVQNLQQKIEIIKTANKDVIDKFNNDLKTFKSSSENGLQNFYAADNLGSKLIKLADDFTHHKLLKESYDQKVDKLKSEIEKLKQSQLPDDHENLKALTTELNTLTKNPTYLTDGQIMKNFVLENKELFASLNAEIAKIMKETNSHDERGALQKSSIGKLLQKEIFDIVYDICRDLGFDKQTGDAVFRAVKAFEMQQSVYGLFNSGLSFFNLGGAKNTGSKQDLLADKLAEVAKDISNLSVIKTKNFMSELNIALSGVNGNQLTYKSFQELKKKYVTIMWNFESDNRNFITKQVPDNYLNLLRGLIKAKNSDSFDQVMDKFKQANEITSKLSLIGMDIKAGVNANDSLRMIFAKDNDPKSIDENKPIFELFSSLVKNNEKNAIKNLLSAVKPYMTADNYSVFGGICNIVTNFRSSHYVKDEINKNKDVDLTTLFKQMMDKTLKGDLSSLLDYLDTQLQKNPLATELRDQRDAIYSDQELVCKDTLCTKITDLFQRIERYNIDKGFDKIVMLNNEGKLNTDTLLSEFEQNPSLLVAIISGEELRGLTSQQKNLLEELSIAFSPLKFALTQAFTDNDKNATLQPEDYRELVKKLLFTHSYDPITLGKNKFNPITSEIRNVCRSCLSTAVSLLPKVVPSLDIDGGKNIGSATISDDGTADYRMALNNQGRLIDEVQHDRDSYVQNVLKLNLSFDQTQQQTIREQRAFWVHNFLADLIFDEEGSQFDKEIDKLEKGEGKIVEPGAKLQRLLQKHAKALAYMIKDPLALNTLPGMIKTKIADLINQIKDAGLDFIAGEADKDTFTDQELEHSAELIRSFLDFDITKGTAELNEAQLNIKLSLLNAEQGLDTSVDSVLEEVSGMIVQPDLDEPEADNQIQQGENAPVQQDNLEAQGEVQENPPVANDDKSDPLNPNSTLQDLDNASHSQDNVMVKFVNNIRKTYFTKLSKMDKLSMVSAAIRYSRAEIDGHISVDKMIGAAFKGAGPIMQKLLQKTPMGDDISTDLKQSFSDMKSNLAPIPENVVQAHLLQIVNNSDGKIKKIEIERSLGAASVGEAFLCKVYTADKPAGVDCVIKILRPDVMNKAHRELDIFREAAKGIPGMDVTFEGSLNTIMEELDLTVEAQNVVSGQLYSNFDPNVQSMKLFDLVPPSTDVLIIEKAPGVTVNNVIKSMEDKLLGDILRPINRMGQDIPGLETPLYFYSVDDLSQNMSDVNVEEETYQDMQKQLLDEYESLLEQRNNLVKFSKEWVTQGIFDTGFYHGDLHAGNIMTSKDKLTVIDFGNCVKLTPVQQENIIRMMAASLDQNGEEFMQGLKALLSQESLNRLAAVKDYKGVQKTVEQHLTEVISAILKKGSGEDTGLKIKLVMEAILKEGIEIPAPIYNFEVCQNSLQNTIDEMNDQIDTVKQLFMMLGSQVMDSHTALTPTATFAKKAVAIFEQHEKFKDANAGLLRLYNEELDKLQNDPGDELKNKVKHVGEYANTPNLDEETRTEVMSAFNFKGDAHYKELYEKWQTTRIANANKTKEGQELTLAETNAENEAFEAFFASYKEKQTDMMQKEYAKLQRFLELRRKPDASFLTGMSEVLSSNKWEAMGTLGTFKAVKYAVKSIFA